ncbi:MAG TPA: glycosyltransferase family 4 protein [Candidatus Dormibacteraeota bacterium]|nr:glycosyltransferase family 4 protein [Candidatus Dormibacteraeota bacterium]
MSVERLLVTGNRFFIRRHGYLFEALAGRVGHVDFLEHRMDLPAARASMTAGTLLHALTRAFRPDGANLSRRFDLRFLRDSYLKSRGSFIATSRRTERAIKALGYVPDLTLHVFGMSSPAWHDFDIPYAYYLDYTMALARRRWAPAAPFFDDRDYRDWIECERISYSHARHLFPMSEIVKRSLVDDYGIDPSRITVVGSSGNFMEPYDGPKTFGSKRILFNGSAFERKGGAIALEAFTLVRRRIPEATLTFIGKAMGTLGEGVTNPGFIASRADLAQLFLSSDVVIAPSHCDPFPGFLIEAMNFGVPSIVFPNDGMVEIIDHDATGVVVEEPSAQALADAITSLLRDGRRLERYSQAGRAKVRRQFNWSTIAEKIVAAADR